MGFWASKTLLSASGAWRVHPARRWPEDGTRTGKGARPASPRHIRSTRYVAFAWFLNREGSGPTARYSNTPSTAFFSSIAIASTISAAFSKWRMRGSIHFGPISTTALKTGKPQKRSARWLAPACSTRHYADPARLEQFMDAMSGVSLGNFDASLTSSTSRSIRAWSISAARRASSPASSRGRHPNLACASNDLPVVQPIAERRIKERGLSDRVKAGSIDFFKEEFPKADVITMGMIPARLGSGQ